MKYFFLYINVPPFFKILLHINVPPSFQKLRHENLVNMIEVFRRKKRFFLVFEYLEHTVLEELEARCGGLGSVTSRKYCYQVLRALDFIHSHDVCSVISKDIFIKIKCLLGIGTSSGCKAGKCKYTS